MSEASDIAAEAFLNGKRAGIAEGREAERKRVRGLIGMARGVGAFSKTFEAELVALLDVDVVSQDEVTGA